MINLVEQRIQIQALLENESGMKWRVVYYRSQA